MSSSRILFTPSAQLSLPIEFQESKASIRWKKKQFAGPKHLIGIEKFLSGARLSGEYEIPLLEPTSEVPERLVAYSERKYVQDAQRSNTWIHFYEDDSKFRGILRSPDLLVKDLRAFAGVIGPDFSIYRNHPKSLKIGTTLTNFAVAAFLQRSGLNVIANVRLSGRDSVGFALAGVPYQSVVALGLHGCVREKENRHHAVEELRILVETCSPICLVVYGSDAYGVLDYPREVGVPIALFRPDTFGRSLDRKVNA